MASLRNTGQKPYCISHVMYRRHNTSRCHARRLLAAHEVLLLLPSMTIMLAEFSLLSLTDVFDLMFDWRVAAYSRAATSKCRNSRALRVTHRMLSFSTSADFIMIMPDGDDARIIISSKRFGRKVTTVLAKPQCRHHFTFTSIS